MIVYRVKAILGFKDGNIFPRSLAPGEVIDVDENTYRRMKQSDPSVELVQRLVPNPRKKVAEKVSAKKKA
jgi:hypothetical protein